MQKFFMLIFLLISGLHSRCQTLQDVPLNSEKKPFQKQIIARVNFLGLMDIYDHNISLGAEYQFNAKWSAGLDAAYIFESSYINNNTRAHGLTLRPFIRYYLKENQKGLLEANLHYKKVVYSIEDWVGRDISNGVPAYEELATFNFNKRVFGMNLVIGNKWYLSRKKDFVNLEPYVGLGVRVKNQKSEDESYAFNRNSFTPPLDPKLVSPAILMGIRLTFKL